MIKLINILKEIVSSETINEASLEVKKLQFRPDRRKVIIDKVWNKSPFKLIDGNEILVDYIIINNTAFNASNPQYKEPALQALENVSKLSFEGDINGKSLIIPASKILKTPELGGKEKGATTAIEKRAMNDLGEQIKNIGYPIDIKIGNEIYYNIVGAQDTPNTPKSDFELVDDRGNSLIFISHKDGSTAKDFQQYGGLSAFKNVPEVQRFAEDVKKEIGGDQMVRGGGFKRKVEDEELGLKAIYGINYGSSDFNKNNVQIVCQGPIRLIKIDDNLYTLKSNHDMLNGTYPTEGYTPYFMATFRSDRNDLGIKQARLGIYPTDTRQTAKEI